jgi:hypothetical protein
MHRPTIGLIAIVLFAVGLALRGRPDDTLGAASLRVGMVMAILWFAQPQLKNLPRWLIAAGAVVLFVAMSWPKVILFALPVAAVLWLIRPRGPRVARRAGQPPTAK